MEADTQSPAVASADGAAAATTPEPAAAEQGPVGYSRGSFEDIFSQAFAAQSDPDPTPAAVLNGADPAVDPDAEGDPDGEQPAEPVVASVTPDDKPGRTPPAKPLSRREQERADRDAEIARLTTENEQLTADRTAEAQRIRDEARAEYDAEQQRKADDAAQAAQSDEARAEVARYERLLTTPDDVLFSTPEGVEDYKWREDRKALLKQVPQAERHWQTKAQQYVETKLEQAQKDQSAFWVDVRSQMADVANGLGIDMAKEWDTRGKTWKDVAQTIETSADARATERVTTELMGRVEKAEAEALRVTKENQDLRDQLLGTTKAPATAGRSSSAAPARPEANYHGTWQENLNAAFS